MSPCPICAKDISATGYLDVIEVGPSGASKLGHIECCPTEALLHYLSLKSQSEIEFFHDMEELAKDPTESRIRRFEKKYGTYEEISQNTRRDSWLTMLAVVAELRQRLTTKYAQPSGTEHSYKKPN